MNLHTPERVYTINNELYKLNNTRVREIDISKLNKIVSDYAALINERESIYNRYPKTRDAADYLATHPTDYNLASIFGFGLCGCLAVAYGINGITDEARKKNSKEYSREKLKT